MVDKTNLERKCHQLKCPKFHGGKKDMTLMFFQPVNCLIQWLINQVSTCVDIIDIFRKILIWLFISVMTGFDF